MDGSTRRSLPHFGGVPRRLVPDNLKTGVAKPDLYIEHMQTGLRIGAERRVPVPG
ncbi:hypothetical protein [Streptomyces sp. NPDC001508]|uniref:hypothetical protein n=1 Tax=Streptomyces sp. NPDC001508 TaxID=3154656 RepID=UPI0033313F41